MKILLTLLLIIPALTLAQPRSQEAKNAFKKEYPCPSTGQNHGPCPGYIIDHINALACGGADHPGNMQWQTEAEAKAKDTWERDGCSVSHSTLSTESSYTPSHYSTSHSYYQGPKGGCFTYSASGKKRYVAHSYCQ